MPNPEPAHAQISRTGLEVTVPPIQGDVIHTCNISNPILVMKYVKLCDDEISKLLCLESISRNKNDLILLCNRK